MLDWGLMPWERGLFFLSVSFFEIRGRVLDLLKLLSLDGLRRSNVLVECEPHIFFTHNIRHPIRIHSHTALLRIFLGLLIATATTCDTKVASTWMRQFLRSTFAVLTRNVQVFFISLVNCSFWYLLDLFLFLVEILILLLEISERMYI